MTEKEKVSLAEIPLADLEKSLTAPQKIYVDCFIENLKRLALPNALPPSVGSVVAYLADHPDEETVPGTLQSWAASNAMTEDWPGCAVIEAAIILTGASRAEGMGNAATRQSFRHVVSSAQDRAIRSRQKIARTNRAGKLEIARPLWKKPVSEITSQEIAEKSGLTTVTLRRYLGNRREVLAPDRNARLGKARAMWQKPATEITSLAIADKVGLSVTILARSLGKRGKG